MVDAAGDSDDEADFTKMDLVSVFHKCTVEKILDDRPIFNISPRDYWSAHDQYFLNRSEKGIEKWRRKENWNFQYL